jgi:hypothetical protein
MLRVSPVRVEQNGRLLNGFAVFQLLDLPATHSPSPAA